MNSIYLINMKKYKKPKITTMYLKGALGLFSPLLSLRETIQVFI
jgi:hypothetical protein